MYFLNEQLIVTPIGYKGLGENMLLMLNQLDYLCAVPLNSSIPVCIDIESVITIKVALVEA